MMDKFNRLAQMDCLLCVGDGPSPGTATFATSTPLSTTRGNSTGHCLQKGPTGLSLRSFWSYVTFCIKFSASADVDDIGLVMVGGYNSTSLDSVIATRDGVNFEALASLPQGCDSGCLAVIDDRTLLHSGGIYDGTGGNNVAFLYDIPRNEWTR